MGDALVPSGEGSKNLLAVFERLNETLDTLHKPVIKELQAVLDELPGSSFGSYEEKLEVVRALEELLSRLSYCLSCAKAGCGEPAVLRCLGGKNRETGSFGFDHKGDGGRRTMHCGSKTLPRLKLIPATRRLRKIRRAQP